MRNIAAKGWTLYGIAVLYLVSGFVWITLSETVISYFLPDQTSHFIPHAINWFAFALFTGVLLWTTIGYRLKKDKQEYTPFSTIDEPFGFAADFSFSLGADGRFADFNAAFEDATGYSRDELLALRFEDLLASEFKDCRFGAFTSPEAAPTVAQRIVGIVCKNGTPQFWDVRSRRLNRPTKAALIENVARDVTKLSVLEASFSDTKLRLEQLVTTANEGIVTADVERRITRVNSKFCAISGYRVEDVIGRRIDDFFDEEIVKACTGELATPRAEPSDDSAIRFVHCDGHPLWILVRTNPIIVNGQFAGSLLMVTDITIRKNAQTLLQESESRFRMLFENSAVGLMIIDDNEKVLDGNDAAARLLGYTRDELRQLSVFDFEAEYTKEELADICEVEGAIKQHAIFETRHRTKSGAIKDVLVAGSRVTLDGEEVWFSSFVEISDRKMAEARVRESEAFFRVTFEQSAACAMIVDRDGRIVECNRAGLKLLGYTLDEIRSLSVYDLDVKFSPDEIRRFGDELFLGSGSFQFETKYRTKGNDVKDLLMAASTIRINGRELSFVSALDITEAKLAETLLRESEARFRVLFERSPIGAMIIHEGGRIADCNPAGLAMLGYSLAELRAMNITEIDAGLSEREILGIETSILEKRSSATFETRHRTKSGQLRDVIIAAAALQIDGVDCGLASFVDVTESRKAEGELARRERMISAINNAAPSLIILWDVVPGTIIYINEIVSKMLGFKPEEMYRMTNTEIFSHFPECELAPMLEYNKRVSKAADGEILAHETAFRNKSGELRLLEIRETPFERNEAGAVTRILSVVDDVTEHKTAVLALQKSEERLQKLHAIIADSGLPHRERIRSLLRLGLSELSLDTAALCEIRDGQPTTLELITSFDPREQQFFCECIQTIGAGSAGHDELMVIQDLAKSDLKDHPIYSRLGARVLLSVPFFEADRLHGRLFLTSQNSHPAVFSNGDIEFLKQMTQWINSELTRKSSEEALRKSEEQLLQAQKLESVGRLAGGIAHDFNNMLTAINGYSDLILTRMRENDPLRNPLIEIKKAGERSAMLTQELLAFSRKQILKPENLNINCAVSELSKMLERLIGEDIALVTLLDPHLKPVTVDRGKLNQAIVNLVVNARDAMPNGGNLTIETRNARLDGESDEFVMLAVTDTGVGMDDETKRQLFEPFFTTKDMGKGTGLGLATIYGFVTQSGGRITFDSEAGNGTVFRVYLPVSTADEVPAENRSKITGARTGTETILFVEDEETVRNLGRDVLRACGYTVITATGGDEAMELCNRDDVKIDLLFTDVVMPGMNGRELWEKMSARRPAMKVLFTSGYTDDIVVRRGISHEGANFLQKPFTIDALVDRVRLALDSDVS